MPVFIRYFFFNLTKGLSRAFPALISGVTGLSIISILDEFNLIVLVQALSQVVDRFKNGMEFIGSFFEFLVIPLSEWGVSVLDLPDLDLQPHWTHFFVVMSILVGAGARATIGQAGSLDYGYRERILKGIVYSILGYSVCVAASVIAGLAPENSVYLIPFLAPAIGLMLNDLIAFLWDVLFRGRGSFSRFLQRQAKPKFTAIIALAAVGALSQQAGLEHVSALLFLAFNGIVCTQYTLIGFRELRQTTQSDEELMRSSTALSEIGFYLLRGYLVAFLTLLSNEMMALAGVGI